MDIFIIYFIFIVLVLIYLFLDNYNETIKNNFKLNSLFNKKDLYKKNQQLPKTNYKYYKNYGVINFKSYKNFNNNDYSNINGSYQQCTNNYIPTLYNFKKIYKKHQEENFSSNMLNIYDEPLKKCQENDMNNGSWDKDGKCSEIGGGVHQICIKNIANNTSDFSKITGQSNWSENRGNNNHCVCLGAWSLYKNKNNENKKILKCDAIPKVSLSKRYISKFSEGWNKWNGLEVNGQIKDGIESLIKNCYDNKDNKSQNLKKNYCKLAKNNNDLKNSNYYNDLCLS